MTKSFLKPGQKWLFFILSSCSVYWVRPRQRVSICMCGKKWGMCMLLDRRNCSGKMTHCIPKVLPGMRVLLGSGWPATIGVMTGSHYELSLRYHLQAKEAESGWDFSHPLAGLGGLWGLRGWDNHKTERAWIPESASERLFTNWDWLYWTAAWIEIYFLCVC